jgi:hypothetical protein
MHYTRQRVSWSCIIHAAHARWWGGQIIAFGAAFESFQWSLNSWATLVACRPLDLIPIFFYYYLFLFWILFLIKFIFYFHPSSFIFLCQICFLFFYCYLFYFGKFVRFKYFFLISSFNIKLIGKWASWLNLNLGFHGLQIWKTNLVLRDLPKVA